MGVWNNSWVKNLPVRPLAPRRKTPGQPHPHSMTSRAGPKLNLALMEMINNLVLASSASHQGSFTMMSPMLLIFEVSSALLLGL